MAYLRDVFFMMLQSDHTRRSGHIIWTVITCTMFRKRNPIMDTIRKRALSSSRADTTNWTRGGGHDLFRGRSDGLVGMSGRRNEVVLRGQVVG